MLAAGVGTGGAAQVRAVAAAAATAAAAEAEACGGSRVRQSAFDGEEFEDRDPDDE